MFLEELIRKCSHKLILAGETTQCQNNCLNSIQNKLADFFENVPHLCLSLAFGIIGITSFAFSMPNHEIIESKEKPFFGKVALVTGSSRGIGRGIVEALAGVGATVIIDYRDKTPRGLEVKDSIEKDGGTAHLVQADITTEEGINSLFEKVKELGGLDILVLSAAGGLEKGADENWARKLNVGSQLRLVDRLLPQMRQGGTVIFITSHPAHSFGEEGVAIPEGYEIVAKTKKECERRLLERRGELSERGIKLLIFCGPLTKETGIINVLRWNARHDKERLAQLESESILPEQWGRCVAKTLLENFKSGQVFLVE